MPSYKPVGNRSPGARSELPPMSTGTMPPPISNNNSRPPLLRALAASGTRRNERHVWHAPMSSCSTANAPSRRKPCAKRPMCDGRPLPPTCVRGVPVGQRRRWHELAWKARQPCAGLPHSCLSWRWEPASLVHHAARVARECPPGRVAAHHRRSDDAARLAHPERAQVAPVRVSARRFTRRFSPLNTSERQTHVPEFHVSPRLVEW